MNKTVEKKLLHFFTGGSIYEDFAAARTKKTAKLRRLIRACFYVHFAAAVICITLAAILRAGTAGVFSVSICEVVLIGLAFMAVGDMTLIKTLLCCGDTAFAAAMFVTGALSANKAPFFAVGAVSIVITACAFGAYYAAICREYLEGFSPLAIRREHYTLLAQISHPPQPELGHTTDRSSDASEAAKGPAVVIPPPKTEIQMLADRLKDILCSPKNDKVEEAMPKGAENEDRAPLTESEFNAPVIPEAPGKTEVKQ